MLLGHAIRGALDLGLHRQTSLKGKNALARLHAVDLFWSIYSLDRMISISLGKPFILQDEEYAASAP
mgnify:FL=1